MKKYYTLAIFISLLAIMVFHTSVQAACQNGFSEVIIRIVPDSWPQETSWHLTDNNGTVIASGGSVGDTVCVPSASCLIFTIYDSFGDGIYAPGGYWLYIDGALVANGAAFGSVATHQFNCPQGMFCTNALPLSYGTFAAPFDNTFYSVTPVTTGIYRITTCQLNTCDTKIWVYSSCAGNLLDEGPPGTYAYNDNASCGLQAELDVILLAGQTYFIRIGDNQDNCPGTVNFSFSYQGAVAGCTDVSSCNYNPLATVDDGSCIYYPNPLCTGPDLKFDSLSFVSSLAMMGVNAGTCDVNEGCVTGYGSRYVIGFTSKILNIGNQPYVVGSPASNPNMFNTVNCHGHAHYEGYGDYRLYDSAGNLVPVGHKNGFCVMDLCGWGTFNCGYMGISAGCYDVYGAGTQCQWVDITDVPNGQYRLAVVINSHHLPDALNHYEQNYANNALQVCIQITRNASGIPSFTLLSGCTPFVDCMGLPGGAAVPDCNGICGGPGIYGNLNGDLQLNTQDVVEYANLLESNPSSATTCNDLNGDGALSVYDAALAMWCIKSPHTIHPAGSTFNDCNFPRNILNPNDTAGLAITSVNFGAGYVDIELLSKTADVKAYQFKLHGIQAASVISLSDPADFPVDIRLISGTNEVFAISQQDSALNRSNSPQPLCRVYFSAVTDTIICIEEIRDIVNQNTERINTYIYNGCVLASPTGLATLPVTLPLVIYPNPVTRTAQLLIAGNRYPDQVDVVDISGRVATAPVTLKDNHYILDLSSLKSGLYMLRVRSGNEQGTARFMKL